MRWIVDRYWWGWVELDCFFLGEVMFFLCVISSCVVLFSLMVWFGCLVWSNCVMLLWMRFCWFVMGIVGKMWVWCRFFVLMLLCYVFYGWFWVSLLSEFEVFLWFCGILWVKIGWVGDIRDDGIVEDDVWLRFGDVCLMILGCSYIDVL